MNVYEMFIEFGRKPGFWLWRITWGNTIAKVTSIDEFNGRHPYYGNPEVRADIFDIHTGAMKEANAVIPVPGTYKTWRMVNPPKWSDDAPFDPMAGKVIVYLPFELNKKAKSFGARWSNLLGYWVIQADDEKHLAKARALGLLDPPPPLVFFKGSYEEINSIEGLNVKWSREHKMWSASSADDVSIKILAEHGFTAIPEVDVCANAI
jgi:hypothetical protein